MKSELKEERVNRIITASAKIFSKNGYNNTKTSDISKEAGIASGTLFNYFPTKLDLLNKTYEYTMLEILELMKTNPETKMKERLKIFWDNTVNYYLEKPYSLDFMMVFENSPLISEETHKKVNKKAYFLIEIYADIKKKEKYGKDFYLISNITMSTLLSTLKSIKEYPDDVERIKKTSFNYLWNGIGHPFED